MDFFFLGGGGGGGSYWMAKEACDYVLSLCLCRNLYGKTLVFTRKHKQEQKQLMLLKTNVDISIKINHGNRHFVQMLRRGESGTSALIGQTQQIALFLCCVSFSHDESEGNH